MDERGDDLAHGPPIEEWEGSDAEKEMRLRETLQGVKTDGGSVGLFKISHIGGHRYAVSLQTSAAKAAARLEPAFPRPSKR